jgi:hypothetical protein
MTPDLQDFGVTDTGTPVILGGENARGQGRRD